jgi:two-component system chemotaxis sensor kinase CheA
VPRLVLDPEGVFVDTSGSIVRRKETTRGKPVLVIDDSLTTRMLEQSILEAVGYEVDVASSAEDGLRMASAREYGLFVCDVEMPGMNGYEFTKETRSRPELAKVPVIMVTSLDSAESRRKGAEAGVSTYIVKSEFDQSTFLRAVAELRV